MMRKKLFIAIAVLLLMSLLLTACSSDIVEPSPVPHANAIPLNSRGMSQTLAE